MKQRVSIADLKIGMFVVSMEGHWWSHPFWKTKFLLTSEDDLSKLRESGVPGVVIDDSRGIGHVASPALRQTPITVSRAPAVTFGRARLQTAPRPSVAVTTGIDLELRRATETVQRSKKEVTRMFSEARLGHAIRPEALTPLVDEICEAVGRDVTAILKVTRLKKKNEYTYLHSVAVSALMMALGRHLKLDEAIVREVGLAGMLHDVGKMAVPQEILDKPGRLTDSELEVIRGHPEKGFDMLIDGEVSPIVRDVILHHHEKIDGTGYPEGLRGDQVSLFARMGAVCDVYDAVTSNRPYKAAWTPSEALSRMREWTGHFDPEMLDAFMRSIAIYPVGQLVRLRSNRLALVNKENRSDPTRPVVRAFYGVLDAMFIACTDVRIANSLNGDDVVGVEHGERWFGADWDRIFTAVNAGERPELRAKAGELPSPRSFLPADIGRADRKFG